MIFTPPCKHAIRAMIYLSGQSMATPVPVIEIAKGAGVPHQFMAKILVQLRNAGLVTSVRGPGGGYRLTRPPDHIRLVEVHEVFENMDEFRSRCVLGLEQCMDDHPCPLHHEWTRMRDEIELRFQMVSIEELRGKLAEKHAHLIMPSEFVSEL